MSRPCAGLAFVAASLAATPALASVTVTYGNPDRFTDAGDRSNDPVKVMQTLAEYLQRLGDRYTPPSLKIRIDVLDLDLAGRTRGDLPTEMRILNGKTDGPCIVMRYSVEADGQVASWRRERLCDPNYLRALPAKYRSNESLVYEKRMLEEWFRERFAASSTAPAQPPR